jgi:soluble lytic murein transglycosylase-like protein
MRIKAFIPIAVLAAVATAAQAGERVTLRNGFEMRCDHHAEMQGRVRLYLSKSEDNYIDFVPQQIAAVEQAPDPAPADLVPAGLVPADSASASSKNPAKTTAFSPSLGAAKLSPADLHEILAKASGEHNLDVDLLASLVKAESGGNVRAVSRTGARGLMQLMPGTASALGVQDSFKPDENVRGGSTYLDALLTRYHDNLALALAAYNAGPGAVDKYRGIPPYSETRAYVARVIHEFNRRVLAREALSRQVASITTPGADSLR